MFLDEMPSARTHEKRRCYFVESIFFRAAAKRDGAASGVVKVHVTVDVVRPHRRVGVFEVGHEDICAAVERIDDHLAIDRSGDLDATVDEIVWNRSDGPVAFANLARLGEEVGKLAGVESSFALLAFSEQRFTPRVELALQRGDEVERLRREDVIPLRAHWRAQLDPVFDS